MLVGGHSVWKCVSALWACWANVTPHVMSITKRIEVMLGIEQQNTEHSVSNEDSVWQKYKYALYGSRKKQV